MKLKYDEKGDFKGLPAFIFTVCQVGAEATLKKELARTYPTLKFAYSRPGFLTFKRTDAQLNLDFELRSIFARSYGVSIESLKNSEVSKLPGMIQALLTLTKKSRMRLHVWERDFYHPTETLHASQKEEMSVLAQELEKRIRGELPPFFEDSPVALPGDLVLDVILIEKDQIWIGAHLHSIAHSPWPGGRPPLTLPEDAPSRAYLKIEEALLWSGAQLVPGDTAVEIGSSPGGASFALLERGLHVVGIDPAKMNSKLIQNPRFHHIPKPVAQVLREDLPESIQWLLLDMNVEPRISLFAVDRLVSRMKPSLLGIFLTIKLNQWKIADEIPGMLEHIRVMGMVRLKAAQLSTCRQEVLIFGLTRRGLSRKVRVWEKSKSIP